MSWEAFYATCFIFGLLASVFAFLAGAVHLHLPGHLHGPAGHGGVGHDGSWWSAGLNFGTITAFLAWFGGMGYLLTRYSPLWAGMALLFAVLTGLGGAAVVFWFLWKLLSYDQSLDASDYEMIGVLGRVSSGIREGGTGEIVFSQAGARRAASARSETGAAIAKDTEVVVTRYENGIAYVRGWDEMASMSAHTSEL